MFALIIIATFNLLADNIFISQYEYYKSDEYKKSAIDNKLRVDNQINLSYEYYYSHNQIFFKTNNKDIYNALSNNDYIYNNITKINGEYVPIVLEGFDNGYVIFKTNDYVLEQFKTKEKVFILFSKDNITYFVTNGFNEYKSVIDCMENKCL